jgi:serine O-acetyltransferase
VFVGAGAKIVGAVAIGDDCRIGANAVVVHDIPSGATAVGIPAKVIRLHGIPVTSGDAAAQGEAAYGLLVQAAADSRESD